MKKLLFFICLLSAFAICLGHTEVNPAEIQKVQSKYPLGSQQNPIKIGLMMVDPFITKNNGVYQGLIMDYWKHISQDKDWHYVFIETPSNYTQVIEDTAKGKYDLALGDFSTTAERMSSVNFSRPYMLNQISILTTAETIGPLKILSSVLYTISDILEIILTNHPNISTPKDKIVVAINEEYQTHEYKINDGDIIALIPPVSGG